MNTRVHGQSICALLSFTGDRPRPETLNRWIYDEVMIGRACRRMLYNQINVNKGPHLDHVVNHTERNVGLESSTIVCHGLRVQKRGGERPQLLLQQ